MKPGICYKHGRVMLHDGPCHDCRNEAEKDLREKCKKCNHDLCPTCTLCHNMDCNKFCRPPNNKCFDILLPIIKT